MSEGAPKRIAIRLAGRDPLRGVPLPWPVNGIGAGSFFNHGFVISGTGA